ncbi:hypothetical protein GCM10010423_65390 [Streptomyces levis]|uniref:Uncharacterized protein n=1 Tax=Streptomyces levis TaxID=285566 RepID=A0ABN3P1C5_9ACTN
MRTISGIDPSSRKIAITTTWGDESDPEMVTFPLPQDHAEGCGIAFRKVAGYFSELREAGHTPFCFLEEPFVGPNPRSIMAQCKIQGAVLAACKEMQVPVVEVHNMTWKAQLIGGKVDKPTITRWVRRNWRDAYEMAYGDQDLMDSAAINRWGKMQLGPKRKIIIRRTREAVHA